MSELNTGTVKKKVLLKSVDFFEQINKLEEENKKLRAALEEIAVIASYNVLPDAVKIHRIATEFFK